MQEDLDRTPLVHGSIAGCGLLERHFEIEDLPGVDLAVPDQLDQLGKKPAHWSGPAVQVDMAEERLVAGKLHAVEHTDVAKAPAWPCGADPSCVGGAGIDR